MLPLAFKPFLSRGGESELSALDSGETGLDVR